jgi:hypothetical protein
MGQQFFDTAGEELAHRRVRKALELYRLAERAGHNADECAAGRWDCHMLAGDFELAWRESDAIAQRGNPDPHRFWDGRPFTGRRVILRCLHGLGDTLQFVRYAPLIRRQAKSLILEAQPKLEDLLREAQLADRVITWGATETAWDQQVEVTELPRIFRTTIHSIPNRVPYIDVPFHSRAREFDPRGLLRVGVVWASSAYNPARSIPIRQMAGLFATPGVSFVSLQAGVEAAEVEPWAGQVTILPEAFTGIFATAQTIKNLDLVITVDTMTAHLAGAMGRPVWTLLPFECDWRWMLARADSPWYPTMRLFRQQRTGDWKPAMDAVQRELTALAACPAPARPDGARQRLPRLVPEP